jgi:hypothetical protein
LRASAIGVPMSRRVCAILGKGDDQKAFAVRVTEAAGIGRLKGRALHQCGQCPGT